MPPHQRLDPEHAARAKLHLRLIDQRQLALGKGPAQTGIEPDPGGRLDGEAVVEQLEPVAPPRLRSIESSVGVAQQEIAILTVEWADGDADAGRDAQSLAVEPDRLAHGVQQLLRRDRGVLLALQPRQDEDEFVAAHACDGIALAQAALEALAQRD